MAPDTQEQHHLHIAKYQINKKRRYPLKSSVEEVFASYAYVPQFSNHFIFLKDS
jgi:hypothetical protein